MSSNDPSRVASPPPQTLSAPLALPHTPAPENPEDRVGRFVLERVTFDGARAVGEAKLQSAWATFQGKSVSLADLRTISRRAEAIYAASGYPFVAVRLKVQQVKEGVVHFDVIEGRISDLTVLGSNPAARRQATAMLEPLVERAPLSLADVDSAYQLARLVPGLSVAGTLRQGSQPGGMDLVVATKRDEAINVYLNVNDLYADSVGPWGVLAGADYAGQSKYGDEASVQAYTSVPVGRQVLLRGSYALGLDSAGTRLTLSGLWGQANPTGSAAAPLELATNIATIRAELAQPIVEARDANLVADVAFEASDQRTRVFSATTLSDDKLRILSASLLGEHTGELGRFSGSVELRQGLDFAGASRPGDANLSRVGGDPQATVVKLSVEAQSANLGKLSLYARSDVQYAAEPLTAPDQYAVGNLTIGRGYQPGLALADSVVAASVEARLGPFPIAHHLQGGTLQGQPFVFVDSARLYDRGAAAYTLTSVGGGVRFQLAGKIETDLVVADPLNGPPGVARPSPTVLLNMTVGLNDLFSLIHRRIAAEAGK
ncbi:MAG TPA: POTRA domain-containing protein [Caulobacteraceae bacterium]|nr:POTRA domain-containing protein [Caulobacteraceae bacterium]